MTGAGRMDPGGLDPAARRRQAAGHVALLTLLCGTLFLYGAGSLPLADPEESRCALIVRDMLRNGNWLRPQFGGQAYFSKPAPFFWLAAAGQKLTGSGELGGRAVAALAALLAVLATYAFARRLAGPTAGLLAGLVLATSGEFLFLARWYRMDMPFAAAIWAAVWWFWRAEGSRNDNGSKRGRGWCGFYAFCAVATLLKGPTGLALPAAIVGAYLVLSGRPRRMVEILHVKGILLYLLIAAPWYVIISVLEPGYAYDFFIREHLGRYAGRTFRHHYIPGLIYIPLLLGGLMPWTVYLPGVCIRYFPRRWRLRSRAPGMLLLWLAILVPLVVFGLTSAKLPHYILPVFPPLAVMVGALLAGWITSHRPDPVMRLGAEALVVVVLVMPLAPAAVELWLGSADVWLAVPAAASVLAAFTMCVCLARARRGRFVRWAVAAFVVTFLHLIAHTAPAGYEQLSMRSLGKLVDPLAARSATLAYWNHRKESFAYYAGASGATKFHGSDPQDLERLAELLASDRPVYVLVANSQRLVELARACAGGFIVLGRSGDCTLVTNCRPAADKPDGLERAGRARPEGKRR